MTRKFTRVALKLKASKVRVSTPSDRQLVTLAITFPPATGKLGPTKLGFASSSRSLDHLLPDPLAFDRALFTLASHGFQVLNRSSMTASAKIAKSRFEELFSTKLTFQAPRGHPKTRFLFPAKNAGWKPHKTISPLIDDAYIQWPALPLTVNAVPPSVAGKDRIYLPNDLRSLLNAQPAQVHNRTGRGVRVVMIDTGFWIDHPFFTQKNCKAIAAPGAASGRQDRHGHGTAMCANLLAVAPDVEFIGIGLDTDAHNITESSLHAAFVEAKKLNPKIIVLSIAFNLYDDIHDCVSATLPNSCVALALEIQRAAASGITVICSAGNGEYAFPAMMPDVIAAGGAAIANDKSLIASDLGSSFVSLPYPGRAVPDVCGLIGTTTNRACLLLPCPAGSVLDRECAAYPDGTGLEDGWCFANGTSAAAPQVAAICALLLEERPSLTPNDLKQIVKHWATDIVQGRSSPGTGSNDAGVGTDVATGAGLISAAECFQHL
jgi:subtilisin family serine protease